jgi:hypothetical protein
VDESTNTEGRNSWTHIAVFGAVAAALGIGAYFVILKSQLTAELNWNITAETNIQSPASITVMTCQYDGRSLDFTGASNPVEEAKAVGLSVSTHHLEEFTARSTQRRICQGGGVTTVIGIKVARNGEEHTTYMKESIYPETDFRIRILDDLRVSVRKERL